MNTLLKKSSIHLISMEKLIHLANFRMSSRPLGVQWLLGLVSLEELTTAAATMSQMPLFLASGNKAQIQCSTLLCVYTLS